MTTRTGLLLIEAISRIRTGRTGNRILAGRSGAWFPVAGHLPAVQGHSSRNRVFRRGPAIGHPDPRRRKGRPRMVGTARARPVHTVYADPPYNTGSADQPTGRTATRIMAGAIPRGSCTAHAGPEPAGAMFCSIDDTLLFQLKPTMDGLLGESAFLASMPWIGYLLPRMCAESPTSTRPSLPGSAATPSPRPASPTAEKPPLPESGCRPRTGRKAMDHTCWHTRGKHLFQVHRPRHQVQPAAAALPSQPPTSTADGLVGGPPQNHHAPAKKWPRRRCRRSAAN